MDESRIEYLESTIAFQDKTIEELSNEIRRQQQEIDTLKLQHRELIRRFDQFDHSDPNQTEPTVEIPPHF